LLISCLIIFFGSLMLFKPNIPDFRCFKALSLEHLDKKFLALAIKISRAVSSARILFPLVTVRSSFFCCLSKIYSFSARLVASCGFPLTFMQTNFSPELECRGVQMLPRCATYLCLDCEVFFDLRQFCLLTDRVVYCDSRSSS